MNLLAVSLGLTWFGCFGISFLTGSPVAVIIWGVAFLLFLGLRGRKVR